jgi:hypothetical protein
VKKVQILSLSILNEYKWILLQKIGLGNQWMPFKTSLQEESYRGIVILIETILSSICEVYCIEFSFFLSICFTCKTFLMDFFAVALTVLIFILSENNGFLKFSVFLYFSEQPARNEQIFFDNSWLIDQNEVNLNRYFFSIR